MAPKSILLFGEVHGIEELPAFFFDAVCNVAASGRPVVVGLEIPVSEQQNVDRFLASGGTPHDRSTLLSARFWARDYQDGRSSEAMAALLLRLQHLRASGARLAILLFDEDQPSDNRDARMAGTIIAYLQTHPDELAIVLTGNLHARTVSGLPWDPGWRPLGWHLARAGLRVMPLDCAGPPGTAWICTTASAKDCGIRSVRLNAPPGGRSGSGYELFVRPSPEGFRGNYFTTQVTASPPAVASTSTRRR